MDAALRFAGFAGKGGRTWPVASRSVFLAALALSLSLNAIPIWLAWRAGSAGNQAEPPTGRAEVLATRTIDASHPIPAAQAADPTDALPVAVETAPAASERPAIAEPPREAGVTRPPMSAARESPAAAPAAPTAPAEPAVGLSELDRSPRPLGEVVPEYPEAAGNRSGSVVLRLVIDEHGVVERAEVLAARPTGLFEDAARTAFLAARFEPGLRGGRPVRSEMTIEVEFTAEDRGSPGAKRY